MDLENASENQQKVWDSIAEEWHKFKTTPSAAATEFINQQKGRILDFGSGSGRNLLGVKNFSNKEFYLVDFSKEMLKLAEERAKKLGIKIKTFHSRLEKTPFKDNFFDAAICVAALHCIETSEGRKNTIKELYRILKPGAMAEVEVWDRNSERFRKSGKEKFIKWRDKGKRYYYLFDESEICSLFENAGFKIIKKIPHKANIVFIAMKPNSLRNH